MRAGWICPVAVSLGILGFGLASIGVGPFGGLLALVPFRRRARWAWFALWFYPVFWLVHLVGGLPPGKDHVHQVVFIVLSPAGLLAPARQFFSRAGCVIPRRRLRSGARENPCLLLGSAVAGDPTAVRPALVSGIRSHAFRGGLDDRPDPGLAAGLFRFVPVCWGDGGGRRAAG